MKPHFFAVKLDETEYWNKSLLRKTGRILGIYIYNEKEETYLAEMRGSFWLVFIHNETEWEISDQTYDEMYEGTAQADFEKYVHSREIEALPLKRPGFFGPCRIDLKKEFPALHRQWEDIEEAREYLQANWIL